MDLPSPGPNNPDDDVFFDALDDCPFHHCTGDGDDPPESSSPATTIRRRSNRRASPDKDATDSGLDSCTVSENNSINGAATSFGHHRRYTNLENSKENENFPEKRDSNRGKICSFSAPSGVSKEQNEESTLTTAANDDAPGESADSAAELTDSSSNLLEYVAGLVVSAIVFQTKLFIVLMKLPILFLFHACLFFVDPFGTMRKGKGFFLGILGKVWCCVFGCIGPSAQRWFQDHKSFWNVAFRCGWGFLWSIYVCCILLALVVSSLVVSGFLVKCLVEKPVQMRQVLNFDYTKQSPVAYVPIISCAAVGGGQDSENNIAVSRWMGKRVLPAKQKLQVTVSLLVPESGYNRNLGVFQIRVELISSNGITIASSSQPCILRFRSEPMRLILTFLKIAPLVTGYISETQTLNVKMRGFIEGDLPTSCVKVTLEQRAGYMPGAGIPEIYESSIVIESELPFFKRIIWHWKMIIFIWITMIAFTMELLFVLVCCWPKIIPRTRQRSGSARGTGTQNNL